MYTLPQRQATNAKRKIRTDEWGKRDDVRSTPNASGDPPNNRPEWDKAMRYTPNVLRLVPTMV